MPLEPKEVDSTQDEDNHRQTALYERYGQVIFGYLRLHVRSLEDAEDLLLDVFLAALEHDNLAALSQGEQLAWLRRVVHNKLLNVYCRVSRSPHVALDSIMDMIFEEENPEQLTLQQEEHGQLGLLVELPHFGGNEQQTINTLLENGIVAFWNTGPSTNTNAILAQGTTFDPRQYIQYNPGGQPPFTNHDLDPTSLSVGIDSQTGVSQINGEMKGDAIARFGTFTQKYINYGLTITLDGKVVSSATIESAINGPFVITGSFTQQRANAIVSILKGTPLPFALKRVS